MSARYKHVVVINDKQAEFGALAEADEAVCRTLLPLVDIRDPAPKPDRRTPWTPYGALTDRLVDPNTGLLGCWGDDAPVLIDLRRVNPRRFDGPHPLDHVLSW